MAKYRSEVHLPAGDRTYVWDGKAFVIPCHDNAKRFCYIGHAKKAAYELNRAQSYSKYPQMERGKYQAVAIDLDAPQPEPAPPIESDDENLYRPSNSDEGERFREIWCEKCERDANQDCEILARSMLGNVSEWRYKLGEPVCTAWKKRSTPPKPDLEPVTTTFMPVQTPQCYVPAKNWSADMAAEPVEKAIAPATTDYPWSSGKMQRCGYSYWVTGDPKNGKGGEYRYFVELRDEQGTAIRTIASEEVFTSIVAATHAAMAAIDRLSAVSLEVS